jgi:hypothetical protein
MPGAGFHFVALEQIKTQLQQQGDNKGALIDQHSRFAHLGALGPDLLRFLPPEDTLLATIDAQGGAGLSVSDLARFQRRSTMVVYALAFRKVILPLWDVLTTGYAFLDKIDGIAAAEDTDQLKGMLNEFNAVLAKGQNLDATMPAGVAELKKVVGLSEVLRPLIQRLAVLGPWKREDWRPFEFLRWSRTGSFLGNLFQQAGKDPELLAYAYGYASHVAASITGEPMINSAVGGPYRTHWWRNRLVANFVDTWVHGYFGTAGATMNGDTPTPPYDSWASIHRSNLHERFRLGNLSGPDAARQVSKGTSALQTGDFPGALAKLLDNTFKATYGGTPFPKEFQDPAIYAQCYVGALAVIWFMTGCLDTRKLGAPPCEKPDWMTTKGQPPPSPVKSNPVNSKSVVFSLLALILFLAGAWLLALGALGAAIAAAILGKKVDWEEVRCTLYWARAILVQMEAGARDVAVRLALGYPSTEDLGARIDPKDLQSPIWALVTCKTKARNGKEYPFRMDPTMQNAPDLNYLSFPQSPIEHPATYAWFSAGQYPDVAVTAPIKSGGVLSGQSQIDLGGAVANARQVIEQAGAPLKNYNLDGDRGYGWLTWDVQTGTSLLNDPVQTDPEP